MERLQNIYNKYNSAKNFHANDGFFAYSHKEQNVSKKQTSYGLHRKYYHIDSSCEYEITINTSSIDDIIIQKQFNEIAKKWKRETGLYSTFAQKVNDSYLEIIHEGKKFLPFILKDLEKGGSVFWHTALKIITKYNPVPDNDFSDVKKVKHAWIEWGKQNRII